MSDFYENRSGYVVTERDLALREKWLSSHTTNSELSSCSPLHATLFTFSRQQPIDRWTTRIGGLPAFPAEHDWPVCESCEEPLAFVAQLDFRGSCLADFLPGDLLMFHYCFSCAPWKADNGQAALRIRTYDPTEKLISEAIVPDALEDDDPGPCYGAPHGTTDYLRDQPDGDYGYYTLLATKIGGYPPLIQPIHPPSDLNGNPMTFLASLGSLRASDIPKIASTPACGDLIWMDMGCVYFWGSKTPAGFEASWFMTCY